MITIQARNVNGALGMCLRMLNDSTLTRNIAPRELRTLEFVEPVCTTYRYPWQRVLLHEKRDANPFFHLAEALWILAGRNDVAPLAQFNSNIRQYSDDGLTFHGAYGHRLRADMDQVAWTIRRLRADPDTRQVVLQIWNAKRDMQEGKRDMPCNTQVYLKIRDGRLNILVTCRSNDALWGAYGANAVQFSVLQEYIAAHVGCAIGEYRQVSDSLHVYLDQGPYQAIKSDVVWDPYLPNYSDLWNHVPLIQDPQRFDRELKHVFDDPLPVFEERFLEHVYKPMVKCWKTRNVEDAALIVAPDWRLAVQQWLKRRQK